MYTYFSFEPYIARLRNIGAEEEFFSDDRTCQAPSLPTLSELQTFASFRRNTRHPNRSKKDNTFISIPPFPTDKTYLLCYTKKTKSTTKKIQLELLKDSWLKNVCSMARGLGIDKVTKLIQDYPFDDNSLSAPNDWAKLKAKAELFSRTEQKTYLAEIHFYARKRHGQRGYDLFELKITKILYEI